jgi:hypothetical protein
MSISSSRPAAPREGRIIPFPAAAAPPLSELPPAPDATGANPATPRANLLGLQELHEVRAEAARHYLKFMLPSIPIAAFVLSFMFSYLILGIETHAHHGGPEAAAVSTTLVDPTLPFMGAALLALVTGALCMAIYFGFLRICALRRPGL